MPKFFFNTRIGADIVRDPEGLVLRDADQAWEVARTTIRELLHGEGQPRHLLAASLEVTDDDGRLVLEFPFSEALFDPSADSTVKH
ncbi:hypothetical protein JQ557_14870 [Bradyrhizobium sp. U87765 SZCCT0131]|uniref:DUF6894 family protein n=1 Tax=unclassified Bradyrhizobium TaxID=2631580 RepID=UPI001BAC2B75|nr:MULTISPECIES: hypothetical protein [unclassified Bradyrhizobium]MBR1219284.1 hypothetical protein [Bradyrhizobium sp. U87765 SZCCT0131]MBR1261935.1 hypothetical protein [Bradyrhizobium sp. U87765 SZCCT0134]MBR1306212.1 hypothetical protein [Bradyrhizobium sp. U87765 SZCCT0110]MBR1317717.1 hypothetical protein [Bradyrhizobium sp. U87765 SZCCT0109]MBR1351419.1 hypothetical protein [Bradyrhizobium sp. U87765 SZCCT0048]